MTLLLSATDELTSKARDTDRQKRVRDPLGRYDLIACLCILGAGTLIILPSIVYGFPNGDDAYVHYRWATQFTEALREESVVYPRWLGTANHGQGSPAMLYYPPLPFFVVSAFNLALQDILLSLSLCCWLSIVLSGLAMYVFARSSLSPWLSLIAGVLYMIAPYHIVDLYQRAALSELWSFAWVPLLLHAVRRVASGGGWRDVTYLAASYAMLLFSHLLITYSVTLLLPVYILLLSRNVRRLFRVACGLALGTGISAVFVVPVLFERQYVRVWVGRYGSSRYGKHFLFENLAEAFRSPLFPSGNERNLYINQTTDIVALGLPILLVLATLVAIIRRRIYQSPLDSLLFRAVWVMTLLSMLMTTRLTQPVWRVIPQLAYMQFPFRWLVLTTAGAVILTAISLSLLGLRSSRTDRLLIAGFLVVLSSSVAISALVIVRASYDQASVTRKLFDQEVPEYRTQWLKKEGKREELRHEELEASASVVDRGDASVRALDDLGVKQTYIVRAKVESVLRLRALYFPGWVARSNGVPVEIRPSADGNILLTVEPGEHTLTLSFEDTWPRTAGKIISAISLAFAIILTFAASVAGRAKREPARHKAGRN